MTGGPGGALRRGRALCGREALAGLRARERVGPRGRGPRGQAGRPERGEGVGLRDGPLRRLGQAGSGLGWWASGMGFGLGCFGFGFSFSFYFFSFLNLIQTKFEFKYKFEFKPHPIKSMHQHECTINF